MTLQGPAGEYAGRKIFDGQRIAPDSLGYLKAYIGKLGLALERLSMLEQAVGTLPGTMVQLSLVTSKSDSRYQNCYIDRYIGRAAPAAPGAPGGQVAGLPEGFRKWAVARN